MEKRALGKTGEKLSIVGFGGIVVRNEEPNDAGRLVGQAVDRGINYFDVAPEYGNAEERLGPALKPYRKSVFLACKTLERTREGAQLELERSLKRLKTDHFDMYLLHAINKPDEAEKALAPGGALETLVRAREKGLVRYLGFSAHHEDAACRLLDTFGFDCVVFPVNYVCWYRGGRFGEKLLAKASEKKTGVLGLKALARRKLGKDEKRPWPKCWYVPVESAEEGALALKFALSKPITTAVSPGHAELLWWACDAAERALEQLTEEDISYLTSQSEGLEPIFPL